MSITTEFEFDVFLSHSSKDKAAVREVAERLRGDGLRVWFDDWVLKPGDNVPAKIEEGLERSRVLVLCMSANAFGADWTRLEAGVFRFRDPLNKERRFVPLRLDDAPIKGSLGQFVYIDWLKEEREAAYGKLVEACWPRGEFDCFRTKCMDLLNQRASVRAVIEGLLNHIDSLLNNEEAFDAARFRRGILSTLAVIAAKRQRNSSLEDLKSIVNDCLSKTSATAEGFHQCISDFRSCFLAVLQALAANGAEYIDADDSILLYADSQSVHAAINRWLQEHETGKLDLIFCQCVGKPMTDNQEFGHAVRCANQIEHGNARIFIARDSAIGDMMRTGRIKKVFFGAHQWGWASCRGAWFRNTQGTFAIAKMAVDFGIPIVVIAEAAKAQAEPLDSQEESGGKWPAKTEHGIPIEYVERSADEIESKSLPFLLVTDHGKYSCADNGLRKRNRVKISDEFCVSKTTTDRTSARSEEIVLRALGTRRPKKSLVFQTPAFVPMRTEGSAGLSVSMQRKAGIRMHDLIATLNVSARINNEQFAEKTRVFRKRACELAMKGVRSWQSLRIQRLLREKFRQVSEVYEFESKLEDAVNYLWNSVGYSDRIDAKLLQEIEELASRLKERASPFLRDANLKNQILDVVGLLGTKLPERCHTIGYFPPVDEQWFDPEIADLLLDRLPDKISWNAVCSHIWQVDFELASRRTTPEDDFIHVLSAEVFSLDFDYDELVAMVTKELTGVWKQNVHETMLFRSLRAWTRRLFYSREEPDIFRNRYRHETLNHYHKLALTAAEELEGSQGSLGGTLVDFIRQNSP